MNLLIGKLEQSAIIRWIFAIVVVLASACCGAFPAFILGAIVGEHRCQVVRGDREVQRVLQIIHDHSPKYDALEINRGPADKFHLEGKLELKKDLDALLQQLTLEFGRDRAKYIMNVDTD